jgi:DNA-binding CsgD family transcriptional regulator
LQLPLGPVVASCEAIHDGPQLVGAIVRFSPPGVEGRAPVRTAWSRLTDSERSVAEHVAAGLTNRETGAKLFISPHTVDYHLRHIFRKLDIDSRIQLARIADQAVTPTES